MSPENVGYSGEALVKEYDRREQNLRLWRPTWQDISDYTMPQKGGITRSLVPGQQNNAQVFDGTAIHANQLLAASMQGALTPATMPWIHLRVRGLQIKVGSEDDRWLEESSRILHEQLNFSNFDSAAHEFYLDLTAFGTGCLFLEEMPGRQAGVRFRSLDIGTYLLEENFEEIVIGVWRKFELTAGVAVKQWPNISDKIKEIAAKEPERRLPFLHVVRPRALATYGMGAQSRRFGSWWVDYDGRELLATGGYHEFPFMATRWSKRSNDEYGYGPGLTALPDTKTLNQLVYLKLAALGKYVNPPLMVRDEGVLGVVRLTPGGITHVRDMEAIKELIQSGGRGIQQAEMEEEKLRAAIRRYFFSDQLQLQEGPAMTAYEVQVRYELMQRILGPTLGRIKSEYQTRMVEREFHILLRAGMLPKMPALIAKMFAAGRLDIEFEGPLARAQRLQESLAIQRLYQIALPLAEVDPTVLDAMDHDENLRIHAEALGVPSKGMRTPEAVAEIRKARIEAQQAQAAQQAELARSEALGKLAPFLKVQQESTEGAGGALAGRV